MLWQIELPEPLTQSKLPGNVGKWYPFDGMIVSITIDHVAGPLWLAVLIVHT